jgi:hypothetical protein
MRDIKADWKRWSPVERVAAISLVLISSLAYVSSLAQALAAG